MSQESPSENIPYAEPTPTVPPGGSLTSDDRLWGMLCHLAALAGIWVFGMTFIGPLVCWLAKRDTSKFVDHHGKESLNFHINILGYSLIAVAFAVATCGVGIVVTIPALICIYVYGIVMTIVAGIKANSGEWYRYPAIIRMIT